MRQIPMSNKKSISVYAASSLSPESLHERSATGLPVLSLLASAVGVHVNVDNVISMNSSSNIKNGFGENHNIKLLNSFAVVIVPRLVTYGFYQ